ncbi:MAG: histidinol-phosphate transaminase [Clostridiales Family XIII bacterium]|nr:histidinol-phosphate transaminase [Clostridiales Family XIII bacterium]
MITTRVTPKETTMPIQFRKELSQIKPYVQGKPVEVVRREFGLDRIEKLASNENQFGPSPKAVAAMTEEIKNLNFYPEGYPFELTQKLSEKLGVAPERFMVGNGGESIIWTISMTFLDAGDEIIVASPSFDIYKLSATLMGAKTVAVPLKDGGFDIDAMLAAVNEKTKIFWLCSPNNPTGNIADKTQINRIIEALPDHVVLVLDEAYYEFASAREGFPTDSTSLLDIHENLIILRTLSKAYGIAGIRVGYVMTSSLIAEKLNSVKQTFGVNRLAQVGAKAALDDDEYMAFVVRSNSEGIAALEQYYESKGWDYFPSYANFSWVNCGRDSHVIFDALQRRGVIIRPGFLWGWDTWLRISTGTEEQIRFLKEQLDEVL